MVKEFELALMAEDYVELNRFYMKKHPVGKKREFRWRVIVPLITALLFCSVCGANWLLTGDTQLLLIEIAVFLLWTLCHLLLRTPVNLFFLKRRIKSRMKREPLFSEPVICLFEEERFSLITKGEKDVCSYDVIVFVGQSEKALYLFKTENTALILPVRCFSSKQEMADFAAFIEEKRSGRRKEEAEQ